MKIRALVAKVDGRPDSARQAFAPGSITSGVVVNVTNGFDSKTPIGHATLIVEGDNVFADIEVDRDIVGLTPALGGRVNSNDIHTTPDGVMHFKHFDVVSIGVCEAPNADTRIPPIASTDMTPATDDPTRV